MGNTDVTRAQVQEGAYSFSEKLLSKVLLALDRQDTGANSWMTITRVAGLISNVSYYSDAAKTKKIFEHQYGRTAKRITSVTAIYYNTDGLTEDSRVTHTIPRETTSTQFIASEESPFSTSKATKI